MRKILLFVLLILVVVFYVGQLHAPVHSAPSPVGFHLVAQKSPAFDIVETVQEHPVIDSGVHNLDELAAAIKRFPDLYAHFDFESAQLKRLDYNILAFTSYRIGKKIYWTKHQLFISAGTLVWIDRFGRMVEWKCGNLLSEFPEIPTLPEDTNYLPPVFDSAPKPAEPIETADVPPFTLPPSSPTTGAVLPPVDGTAPPLTPNLCCFVPGPGPKTPPIDAPEPSTRALTIFGLVSLMTMAVVREKLSL